MVLSDWTSATVAERLMARTVIDDGSGCWLWTGALDTSGYGLIGVRPRRAEKTHRVAWMLNYGDIPNGLSVLHSCDIRHCVNLDHLSVGTNADNVADRNRKRRQAHGERHASCRLTDDEVEEIRRRWVPGARFPHPGSSRVLAEEFGVVPLHISALGRYRKRKTETNRPTLVVKGH